MPEGDPVPRNEEECLDARLVELLRLMRDRHMAVHGIGGPEQPVSSSWRRGSRGTF